MAKKGQTFRNYSEEWKQNAVQMYEQEGMSYGAIAKALGMPSSTQIKGWVKKHRNGESFTDQRGKKWKLHQ